MQNFISSHWKKINSLTNQNIELQNFRRNKLKSLGMDDATKNPTINLAYLDFMKKKYGNELKKLISENNIGNSDLILYERGYKIDLAELKSIYYYKEIEKLKNISKVTLEIGCGFGSFASKIIKEGTKYVGISLENSLSCTKYFLSKNFKDKKIFLSTKENLELDKDLFNKFDIFLLLPGNLISNQIKFDTVVAINTFQEIEEKIANFYREKVFFDNTINGTLFLLVNNYFSKSSFFTSNFNTTVLDNNWKVIDSRRSEFFTRDHLLFLCRNFSSGPNEKLQMEINKIKVEENFYLDEDNNSKKISNRILVLFIYFFFRIFNNKDEAKFLLKKFIYKKINKNIKKKTNYKFYEHQIDDLMF